MNSVTNPVLRGHAPDPSVVRVGDDFYLANSTFGFLPGNPISHSTDLVTWRDEGSTGGAARFSQVLIEERLKTVPPAFQIPY